MNLAFTKRNYTIKILRFKNEDCILKIREKTQAISIASLYNIEGIFSLYFALTSTFYSCCQTVLIGVASQAEMYQKLCATSLLLELSYVFER